MLRDQNRILAEEIQVLKTKLAQANRRADSWQESYHNAMDTMSKMSRARP
jgi:outer membrane murein-binding lipoprotein Lpp